MSRRLPISNRSNPNLLYADFKRVESYSNDYDSPLTSRKSPFAKKDDLYLAQLINSSRSTQSPPNEQEFGELPLEQQIDALLSDSSKKHIDANELHRLFCDQAQDHRKKKSMSRAALNATPSQFLSNTILAADLTIQTNTDQPSKTPRYKIALPPLNVPDPFSSENAGKHWTFRQPVKHAQSSRTVSVNASLISDNYRKNILDTPRERSILGVKHIKSQSTLKLTPQSLDHTMFKLGNVSNKHVSASVRGPLKKRRDNSSPLELLEDPSKNRNSLYDSMTESVAQQLKNPQLLTSGGIVISKNLNKLQTASREAKFLLKGPQEEGEDHEQQIDLKLLERSQARSQTLLIDGDKRNVGMPISNRHIPTSTRNLDTLANEMIDEREETNFVMKSTPREIKRIEANIAKKKEFYNKWYMPVKFWGIEKEGGARGKKYNALKKDINYFYNNMNNFGGQLPRSPSKGSSHYNSQQVAYENVQEKLRQNTVLKKYKKELLDGHQRIPNCLNAIEEDLKN